MSQNKPNAELSSILHDYDNAVKKRSSVITIDNFVANVNNQIRDKIRGMNNYDRELMWAALYHPEKKWFKNIKKWHDALIRLWERAPYDYNKIPEEKQNKISCMAKELCNWEKFLSVYNEDINAATEFQKSLDELLARFQKLSRTQSYMDDLLNRYILNTTYHEYPDEDMLLHPLEILFIQQNYEIHLVPKDTVLPEKSGRNIPNDTILTYFGHSCRPWPGSD